MKKVILMLFAMALAVCGCKDDSYESANYVGNYKGTYHIIKQSDSGNSSTKQGTLHFTQNPVNKENLLWEYSIDMQKTKDGVYETVENSLTSEMIIMAANLINIGDYVEGTVDKIKAEATFSGSSLTMKIYYTVKMETVGGIEFEVVIATFNGTKESK